MNRYTITATSPNGAISKTRTVSTEALRAVHRAAGIHDDSTDLLLALIELRGHGTVTTPNGSKLLIQVAA